MQKTSQDKRTQMFRLMPRQNPQGENPIDILLDRYQMFRERDNPILYNDNEVKVKSLTVKLSSKNQTTVEQKMLREPIKIAKCHL